MLAHFLGSRLFRLRCSWVAQSDLAHARSITTRPIDNLSYVIGERNVPLLVETLYRNLRNTVERFATNLAVIDHHHATTPRTVTYEQFLDRVESIASGMVALGVSHGDRIAVYATNSLEWAVLQYAAAMVGAIQVSLNPALRHDELVHALSKTQCSVIFLSKEYKKQSQLPILESALPALPHLRICVLIDAHSHDALPPGWLEWEDVLASGQSRAHRSAAFKQESTVRPSEAANIQFTSGTTGMPKAATLSHINILNNGYFIGQRLRYSPRDRVCIPVPLFHCFGQVLGNLACTTSGATMVYPGPGFDPEQTLKAIVRSRATSIYGTPTHFISMLDAPRFSLYDTASSLRTGIMAGAPCPPPIMRRVREEMGAHDVSICFGQTETSPVSFQTLPNDSEERRVGTVGTIHPHLEACVVDPDSKRERLPLNTPGELIVRGYSVMMGYFGDDEATAKTIDADGFYRTGDLASIDGDGYLRIVGRIKDVVIRGGENLFPKEIEDFLHTHPDVSEVQVFGVPDKKYGEQLCAWVKLKNGGSTGHHQQLREWCTGKISKHKIPKYWKIVSEYPTTTSGKPQKFIMRKMASEELGLGGR